MEQTTTDSGQLHMPGDSEDPLGVRENLKNVKHRIVVFSGKGGVGKTTISVNLAYALAKRDKAVGLLDADVTGPDVPNMVGLKEQPQTEGGNRLLPPKHHGVRVISMASIIPESSPIIWRGPLRSRVLEQFLGDVAWGALDYLIADLPPGTGDEVLTMAQRMEPRMAVIVTTPQEMSLIDSRRAINMARQLNIPKIGIVENMSGLKCPECGHAMELFGSGGGRRLASEWGVSLLGTVPISMSARAGADVGRPIILEDESASISLALLETAAAMVKEIEEE
jgi:Mrp family chromosome partitioning ATPase